MYIYKITNTTNNKMYIGQSVPENNWRMTNHRYQLNKGIHKSLHLQSAWNKYGKDKFLFEKIDFANDFAELDRLETHYIKKFKSTDRRYGYNIQGGGHSLHAHADETKQRISAANTGNRHTAAQKAKWAKEKRTNIYPTHIVSPTGRKYKVVNIKEFCRVHNIDKGNLMHVLKKQSLHAKGWHLETTAPELCNNGYASSLRQRRIEYLPLMSPDGKIHTIDTTLAEFCRVHNLGTTHVRQLFQRTRKTHQGWRLANA